MENSTCIFIYVIYLFTVVTKDQNVINLIKDACPHLLIEHGNQGLESTEIPVCCSKSQVETFIGKYKHDIPG